MSRPAPRVSALLQAALLVACSSGDKSGGPVDTGPAGVDSGFRDSDGDGHPDVADCGPADSAVFPGADERCNDIDDDCDGEIDEEAVDQLTLWLDADGDGFGDPDTPAEAACIATPGTSSLDGDCNDDDAAVHPDANELCWSGQDDDCDGTPGVCGPSGTPDTSALTARWRGSLAGDQLGASVVWLADPQGSGTSALAVGVPGLGGGMGGVAVITAPLDEAAGSLGVTAATTPAAQAGTAVTALGDVDGDGLIDLLVGEPGASSGRGQATVWLGDASGFVPDAGRMEGAAAGDAAGSALSAADLDGDGQIDAIVGIPKETTGGFRGMVAIHAGPLNAISATTDDATARIHGRSPGGQTGAGVAADGDVNGDGMADLVVGSPMEEAGEVAVWFGPVSGDQQLEDADLRYIGDGVAYEVGRTVAWAGDTDGDGSDDLVVGAPQGSLDGAVVLFYGSALTAADGIFGGEAVGAAITGTHYQSGGIARIGDVNGDGLPDVYGGGPGVHWSPLSGGIDAADADLRLLPATTELGRDNPGWLPAQLSTGSAADPDLDGDGHAEVIFAGPNLAPDGQTRAGEVQVLSSRGW